jgi:hypothetical protein
MEALTATEVEVVSYFVTVGWVARHYSVPRLAVYRAITRGDLPAVRLAASNVYLFDRRKLPVKFPTRR